LNAFNYFEKGAAMEVNNRSKRRLNQRYWLLVGAVIGAGYGLSLRLLAATHFAGLEVMSFGFIFFMPFALGCVTVYVAELREKQTAWVWVLLPWVPVVGALAGTILALLEGLICVVMFLPLALVLSTAGGIAGGVAGRLIRSRRARTITVTCVMVLPFFTMAWERPVFYQLESRRVENVIDIRATPEAVWRNIERVPAIGKDELPNTWAGKIGFPDPIEATLSHEGVGGVRDASFERGLSFLETVDVWEPERRLSFKIAANTDQIPPTTLDEHVRVGGEYFDVLRGEYRLEPLGNGITRLHLTSEHRLSTDFNWYAHLWTDAVMSDLQWRILQVIKRRCEGGNLRFSR
jgi:uncharacterized membrane protein YhaH (DUF805 family)